MTYSISTSHTTSSNSVGTFVDTDLSQPTTLDYVTWQDSGVFALNAVVQWEITEGDWVFDTEGNPIFITDKPPFPYNSQLELFDAREYEI